MERCNKWGADSKAELEVPKWSSHHQGHFVSLRPYIPYQGKERFYSFNISTKVTSKAFGHLK